MCVTDFTLELPESLTAHYPMPERSSCHLLSLDGPAGALTHGTFTDILDKLNPDDLLVFNSARAIPARLFGRKASSGKIEVLVERMLDDKRILAHICASKAPKPGAELLLGDDESIKAMILTRHSALFEAEFSDERPVLEILNGIGHMPLPPYIDRPDEDADRELYQTVYDTRPGAVVALTAGLYFNELLLDKLRVKGAEMAFVTLHVGVGTFQSACVNSIEEHTMHSEYVEVPQEVVDAVPAAKACGNRMIVVGTTSTRLLESVAQAARDALIVPFFDDMQIFIYPDYQYQVIDVLVTNLHLPEFTPIMLVSAFADYQHTMNAYKVAVEQKYRLSSYGDVMFITYNPQVVSERPWQGRPAGVSDAMTHFLATESLRGEYENVGLFF